MSIFAQFKRSTSQYICTDSFGNTIYLVTDDITGEQFYGVPVTTLHGKRYWSILELQPKEVVHHEKMMKKDLNIY